MARQTEGVTYHQIKRIADWQLSEEAQRQALAQLVNAIRVFLHIPRRGIFQKSLSSKNGSKLQKDRIISR
jgi:hypothetical protein